MLDGYNDFRGTTRAARASSLDPVSIAMLACSFAGSFLGTTAAMALFRVFA